MFLSQKIDALVIELATTPATTLVDVLAANRVATRIHENSLISAMPKNLNVPHEDL